MILNYQPVLSRFYWLLLLDCSCALFHSDALIDPFSHLLVQRPGENRHSYSFRPVPSDNCNGNVKMVNRGLKKITAVSSFSVCSCFLLLERLADSLFSSFLSKLSTVGNSSCEIVVNITALCMYNCIPFVLCSIRNIHVLCCLSFTFSFRGFTCR